MDDLSNLLVLPEGTREILPTSVPKVSRDTRMFRGLTWVPIFCANCGAPGGFIPEETKDFAFYLCDAKQRDCVAAWGELAGTMVVPDEVFWQRVKLAQIEAYGRLLSPAEIVESLKQSDNPLAKLARDRYSLPEYNEAKRR